MISFCKACRAINCSFLLIKVLNSLKTPFELYKCEIPIQPVISQLRHIAWVCLFWCLIQLLFSLQNPKRCWTALARAWILVCRLAILKRARRSYFVFMSPGYRVFRLKFSLTKITLFAFSGIHFLIYCCLNATCSFCIAVTISEQNRVQKLRLVISLLGRRRF